MAGLTIYIDDKDLKKAQKGTQAKLNILDDVNEHKFRKLYDSDNKSWYTGFTGRRGEDTNGEVYLANDMSNAEIRKEFPGALIKVENGIKTFRLPKVNEEVVLPKVDNKWTSVVVLPNGQEERQMVVLVPEKTTITKEIPKYKYDEKAYRDMVAFDSPWTTPFWTMAMVSPEGKNYADRFHELSFYNANDINDITKIENEDFDFVNTDKLQTSDRIQGRNGLWIVDDNGSLRGIGYDNRGRIINQSDLEYDNRSGYWVDRPKTNKTTITTIDQNAVKKNKFIKEMNDANRLANMVNAGQNRTWNLQYQQGGPSKILNQVNSSNSNFVQRLKDPYRQTIKDWVDRHSVATHKLSVGTDENGNYFVYPNVQEINGKLVDFTKPKFGKWTGFDSAIQNQDTVRFDNFDDALWFTQNYKNYYPSFDKYQQGGQTGLTILIDDEQFKKGGHIHIKEKNKGKFTKQAQSAGMSVQEFARHVLAHKDRYPASTVKRANFARNASKWSK